MTPHVLEALPLWIEGDLSVQEQMRIENHLAHCPACEAAAEALRTSQAWLRGAMASPFEASDTAGLRASVMEQIRVEAARPTRPFAIRPALLAASAAALLIAPLVWRFERGRSGGAPPAAPAAAVAAPPPEAAGPAATWPETTPHRAQTRTKPKPETEVSPPGEPARIEFQTSNPNVRIIWLAQATPRPEPPSTSEEKS